MPALHFRLSAILVAAGLAAAAQEPFATCPQLPRGVGPITVVDSQGRYVGRILPQKRYWVTLDRIPVFLQRALLAVEDARFYEHGGIDVRSIARAFVKDVAKGRAAEGGSTITQQLIKNKFLSAEPTLDRKVKEARMAMDFETKYTKNQILEMYFNEIYYGNGAQGLAQAARLYFGKSPEELTEGECVTLAGIPKNPGKYNPLGKVQDIALRREVVLKRLEDLHQITPQQKAALRSQWGAVQGPGRAPHYLAQIRATLVKLYGQDALEMGGLDITAPLDLDLQKAAEEALRAGVRRVSPDLQGALVCLDPATGDVLAAVGGLDGNQNSLNRAFASQRQPGSAIKPLIYADALEKGLTASSIWSDEPVAYDRGGGATWKPLNYGRERLGDITMREALAHSSNVVTVKILDQIGVPDFVDFAGRMGLALRAQNGLSLALGTDEVTLKDLVQAYTPLAAAGVRAEARTITRIHDRRRDVWTEFPPALAPVLSPEAAYVTTNMLGDVLTYGTAKSLQPFSREHPCAGKTGTTDNYQDAWFVGYTPNLITGVWVGYDRPRSLGRGFTGGAVAAPIWARFMEKALEPRPVLDFPRPEDIVTATIDPATGLLATPACPRKAEELYLPGTEPDQPCPLHPPQEAPQPPVP
ncbi:transglycosylase domain-containing protein [Mesoterricola silvestris]|uniref:Penicillin-binding protein 1A n=1 Tax=Mesoterricola silvestris TaxID=2927979 RepID=A0AA48GHZ7_9BACT|nr:PBP1A family penicillin-binding protein [Mesoterricola silvestris]BDU73256.1 penicillin-binding protein 1A [Mesoterricola silvestris]